MLSNAMQTRCCVVGGGPAGMMMGFLLAFQIAIFIKLFLH